MNFAALRVETEQTARETARVEGLQIVGALADADGDEIGRAHV